MNTDPADTRSPHLDLEDLIAEATGQAIDDRAREHLTRCEHCRAEVNRWDLVASGVRGLAAAAGPKAAAPQAAEPGLAGRGAPDSVYWRVPGGASCWWLAAWPPRSSSWSG